MIQSFFPSGPRSSPLIGTDLFLIREKSVSRSTVSTKRYTFSAVSRLMILKWFAVIYLAVAYKGEICAERLRKMVGMT